jgi:hypothetical protein
MVMRVLVLATVLLVSSGLCSSRAEEPAKEAPSATPQAVPVPSDRDPAQPRDRYSERDRSGGDDREVNRDGRSRRGDGGHMGQWDREMGSGRSMQRDRDDDRNGDKDRGRYGDREDRTGRPPDRADQGRGYGDAHDNDAPRRRVKVCIEFDNGDEYCRDQRR